MREGFFQYVAVCALVCLVYAAPDAWKWAPVCTLLFVGFVLLPKNASAGRSSGEAVSPTRERGD